MEKQLRPLFKKADNNYGAIKVSTAVNTDKWSHCVLVSCDCAAASVAGDIR